MHGASKNFLNSNTSKFCKSVAFCNSTSNKQSIIRDSLLVLSIIEKESCINVNQISKRTSFTVRKVNLCLKFLRESGTIEQNGQSFKLLMAKIY